MDKYKEYLLASIIPLGGIAMFYVKRFINYKDNNEKKEYLSLSNLRDNNYYTSIDSNIQDLRKKSRILVIDDEDFSPINNLKSNGFKIEVQMDIDRISDVEDYNIILVDIMGVGIGIDPINQGAHLIHQMKKTFPEKFIIAYTGGANQDLTSIAAEYADKYLPKDTSVDRWCDVLDDACQTVSNPIKSWEKFRHRLLDKGISPINLAELEDTYVRSINGSPKDTKTNLQQKSDQLGINPDIRRIITSVLSSVILKEVDKI